MEEKLEKMDIQIFDETDLRVSDKHPTFGPIDFGGAIPQVGDLIAIPAVPRESGRDPRMRRVMERYFWPSIDGKPVRVGLLVGERRARNPSRKKTVINTESVSPPSAKTDISFIVQQIYTCLNLAKECPDAEMAVALRNLAEAFADRAIVLGADPNTIPRGTSRSSL